jgi:hypothetical protein
VKALVVLASIHYSGDGIVAKNSYQTSSGAALRYDQSASNVGRGSKEASRSGGR